MTEIYYIPLKVNFEFLNLPKHLIEYIVEPKTDTEMLTKINKIKNSIGEIEIVQKFDSKEFNYILFANQFINTFYSIFEIPVILNGNIYKQAVSPLQKTKFYSEANELLNTFGVKLRVHSHKGVHLSELFKQTIELKNMLNLHEHNIDIMFNEKVHPILEYVPTPDLSFTQLYPEQMRYHNIQPQQTINSDIGKVKIIGKYHINTDWVENFFNKIIDDINTVTNRINVTIEKAEEFQNAIDELKKNNYTTENKNLLNQIAIDSYKSYLDTFNKELETSTKEKYDLEEQYNEYAKVINRLYSKFNPPINNGIVYEGTEILMSKLIHYTQKYDKISDFNINELTDLRDDLTKIIDSSKNKNQLRTENVMSKVATKLDIDAQKELSKSLTLNLTLNSLDELDTEQLKIVRNKCKEIVNNRYYGGVPTDDDKVTIPVDEIVINTKTGVVYVNDSETTVMRINKDMRVETKHIIHHISQHNFIDINYTSMHLILKNNS